MDARKLSLFKLILWHKTTPLLCLVYLLLTTNGIHAQDSPRYKNEIGLTLLNVQKTQTPHNYFHENNRPIHFLSGIQYKRRFRHSALRVGVDYTTDEKNSSRNYLLHYHGSSYKFTSISLGYEKQFSSGKFIPYWAMDASYSKETYSMFSELNHWTHSLGNRKITSNIFGMASVLGLRYYFFKRLSITLESSLFFHYSQSKSTEERSELIGTSNAKTQNFSDYQEQSGMHHNLISAFRLSYIF